LYEGKPAGKKVLLYLVGFDSLRSTNDYLLNSNIIPVLKNQGGWMRKTIFILLISVLAGVLLAACSPASSAEASANAVEEYLNTLVAKDADRLPSLVCGEWEEDALIELDSFQAVEVRLEGASCQQTGTDGDTALVDCTGSIVATYNDEDQELDLSVRTYEVVQQGGDWLVCGTR
jgi:hypothetical protein